MLDPNTAIAERFDEKCQEADDNIVEFTPVWLPYDSEHEPLTAGNGSCMSCYPNCKGYRPGPNSYCSTPGCGHSFTMHH